MSLSSENKQPPPVPARPAGLYHPLAKVDSTPVPMTLSPRKSVEGSSIGYEMKDLRSTYSRAHSRNVSSASKVAGDDVLSSRMNPGIINSPGYYPLIDSKQESDKKATDGSEVKHMESALLELLSDFRSGKLRAFGNDGSLEQMMAIRDQQEKLAKMHFDLLAKRSRNSSSKDGETAPVDTMKELIFGLEQLSMSIEKLHSSSAEPKVFESNNSASTSKS
ncbi:uncharacterized protein LOC136038687 isoform X2 [Artemia franciscana]|uniref:Uncharacterized protein n=1 Tax=Artemia franciscana TaxID=6661 RepID=A0AA88I6F2_ARTSF|nr:hypothetical protein QYM36_010659 [Artemia franciscana]